MTSPNIGRADVVIDADVDAERLAAGARRAGQTGGDTMAKSFVQRFKRTFRRQAISGAGGFFDLSGPQFARGFRNAGDTGARAFAGGFRGRLQRGRGFLLDFFQTDLPRLARFGERGAVALIGGFRKAFSGAGGLLKKGFGKLNQLSHFQKLLGLLALSLVALTPVIGNVYNALLEMAGVIVGLPAGLAAAAAAFGVFKAGMKGLKFAFQPVKDEFKGFEREVSGVFARLRPIVRSFAQSELPQVRRALVRLAGAFSGVIGSFLQAFQTANGGTRMAAFIDNVSRAVSNLRAAARPLVAILLQLIEQVGARLPELTARLSEVLDRLAGKAEHVDFGQVFVTAINGLVNLGYALVAAGRDLRDFFTAAVEEDLGEG